MTTSITSSATQTLISAGGNPSALVIENGGIVSGIGKNKIINGNFAINQRAVSGTVVLAAGAYGHDRFKAGASGCTYTFATLENITTITISAGSLIQVIEGLNLMSGPVVLSWEGTAQGKIGAGAYGNSGVTGTAVGGTDLSVEFNTGTLSLVQLETGSYKSAFEHRPYGMELSLCQRYYFRVRSTQALNVRFVPGFNRTTTTANFIIPFPVYMRSNPTALEQSGNAAAYAVAYLTGIISCNTVPVFTSALEYCAVVSFSVAGGLTAGQGVAATFISNLNGYLGWSTEL